MATLYITTQGAKLHKESRRLKVTKDDEEIQSIPLIKVEQVHIFGNVSITTPALTWLMSENIDVIFSNIHGKYRGRVVGETGGQSQLRRWQYRRVDNTIFAANTARTIVKAKLHNSRTLLMRYRRRNNLPELTPAIGQLAGLIDRADRAQTVNSLRGVEGIGAAVYFEAFQKLIQNPDFRFQKRTRRPPTDPTNVLLSFGYTLLVHQIYSAVEAVGLDPYLGTLHADAYNRPSMALDLAEEFRSIIVDSIVLRCINAERITAANFTRRPENTDRPILLDDAGRKTFLTEFEQRLALTFTHPATGEKVTYRRCFEMQARDMARAIQAEGLYQPFTVR